MADKESTIRTISDKAPLCFLPNGDLVCYHKGKVYVLSNNNVVKQISIPISFMERLLSWSKVATRFLRLGVRTAIALDDNIIIFSIGNFLYELNINNGKISNGWYCGKGIRPLILTAVKDVDGFDNSIYFGGYLVNSSMKPVSIYKRIGVDSWSVVYTFPAGTINHVHNIVADKYRKCLWIFTGDFGEASAIWKVQNSFNQIKRVLHNSQKYRGCVAYAIPEGVLYATDTPFAKNSIYLLCTKTLDCREVYPLHGSCIYGCKWGNRYVFSSTVEGDGRSMSFWDLCFGRKRGAGIIDEYVHMYVGDLSLGFKEVYKEKKDKLPFICQFGVFRFPTGVNNGNMLYFQPVATTKNDLVLLGLKKEILK